MTEFYCCLFKARNSEIKPYLLRLENVSKDFAVNNMINKQTKNNKSKTELNRYVYSFSVDYNIIDNSNVTNIHKYLMKKARYKITFGHVKINLYWIIN